MTSACPIATSLTLMDEGTRLSILMSPQTPEEKLGMKAVPYHKLVGKLLYLDIAMCPDITYVIGMLCCFVDNPGEAQWNTAKCVLQYLRGMVDMLLAYSGSLSPDLFMALSDADLGGNPDNSHSTGGSTICIGGGAMQWGSWLHPHMRYFHEAPQKGQVCEVPCHAWAVQLIVHLV